MLAEAHLHLQLLDQPLQHIRCSLALQDWCREVAQILQGTSSGHRASAMWNLRYYSYWEEFYLISFLLALQYYIINKEYTRIIISFIICIVIVIVVMKVLL